MNADIFKQIDLFKIPANLYLTANAANKDKNSSLRIGTVMGGLLSIMSITMMIGYMAYSFIEMYDTHKDVYKSVTLVNKMNTEHLSQATINSFNFMPSISLTAFDKDNAMEDIYHHGVDITTVAVDYEKLKDYFDVVLAVRHRHDGESIFYEVPFRNCKNSDFEERNLPVSASNSKVLKYRLCPDIEDKDFFYQVKNGYSN